MMIEIIRAAVKGMIRNDLVIGKVEKFNSSDWTIDVTLNSGPSIEEVTIRAVLNSESTGIFVEPKVGSYVLCALNDGKLENMSVVLYSEIVNIKFLPKEKLILRGDSFGGLVKNDELKQNIDQLKQAVETIKSAVFSALNAVGAGSAANGAAGASTFQAQTASINIQFQDMENKNVKHG